jgi:hypothetical protein
MSDAQPERAAMASKGRVSFKGKGRAVDRFTILLARP